MAQGGFLIKFDDKEAVRCVEATFQYDGWRYITNGHDWQEIPKGVKSITVEVEAE